MSEKPARVRSSQRPEVTDELTRVGRRVTELRTNRGLSLRQLAARCDVSSDVIWRLENAAGDVRLGTLVVVAQGLGISLQQLIEN